MGTYFDKHPNYEAYKDILEVATSTVDPAKRTKLYQAVQILSAQDVPWIPLWSMTNEMVIATRKNITGATLNITMDIQIWNIVKQ